jgi:hypothetical protein
MLHAETVSFSNQDLFDQTRQRNKKEQTSTITDHWTLRIVRCCVKYWESTVIWRKRRLIDGDFDLYD